jgi:predicted Fe-Mo cluster-binding NifX family protein
MKIGVPAMGESLHSAVDERFGRCPFFVLVDADSLVLEVIRNPGPGERDAAGILACQALMEKGVDAVAVKNIGHNALVSLSGGGVRVYAGAQGSILDTIERLKKGQLDPAETATVGFQDGMAEGEGE